MATVKRRELSDPRTNPLLNLQAYVNHAIQHAFLHLSSNQGRHISSTDGVDIFYKDWGPRDAQVIFFHHGWPLSANDWDAQMLFFLAHGFRVVAHDRRGHGRPSQVWNGYDMDHYADDVAAVVKHLGVDTAVNIGHSTGGCEAVRYIARHGEDRVAKGALLSAVPPLMVKADTNPGGTSKKVFDNFQAQLAGEPGEVLL